MANRADARAVPLPNGQFRGEFRRVHKSWDAVSVNGQVQSYDTAEQAELAAWRALGRYLQPDLVAGGDRYSAARESADKGFRQLFPGKGRKAVTVETR